MSSSDQRRFPRALAALLGACLSPAAIAGVVAITNPGFEADAVVPGAFSVGVPTGWQLYDPGGGINQTDNAVGLIRPLPGVEFFPLGTPEGQQAALVYLAGDATGPAGLQQTLPSVLTPLTIYNLWVDVGNIASGTSLPGSADGGGQYYDLSGFPGYRIELLAGDTVLAADENGVSAGLGEGQFATAFLQFSSGAAPALAGQPLTIRLINLDQKPPGEAPGIEVDFDNVRLEALPGGVPSGVPEPASAWLLVAAALAGGCRPWRRAGRDRATGASS